MMCRTASAVDRAAVASKAPCSRFSPYSSPTGSAASTKTSLTSTNRSPGGAGHSTYWLPSNIPSGTLGGTSRAVMVPLRSRYGGGCQALTPPRLTRWPGRCARQARGDELLPAELRVQHRVAALFGEREARSPGIAQRGDRQRPEQAGPQPVAPRVDHRDEQL